MGECLLCDALRVEVIPYRFADGDSVNDLALRYGLSPPAVEGILRAAGAKARRPRRGAVHWLGTLSDEDAGLVACSPGADWRGTHDPAEVTCRRCRRRLQPTPEVRRTPRTPLGARILALRAQLAALGVPTLSEAEIAREVRERRADE